MGSVKKRKDTGRWRGRYRDASGREHAKDFDRQTDARRWVAEEELKVHRGDWTDPRRATVTVGELWPDWFAAQRLKPSTRASYDSLWRTVVAPTWGETPLSKVTTAGVRRWVNNAEGPRGPVSASRARQAHHVLSALLDSAVEDGRIPQNPARPATTNRRGFLPPLPRQEMHCLSRAQLLALADAIPSHRPAIYLLGFCALRSGEVAGLRVGDVDLLRQRLHIRRNIVEISGQLVEGEPKSARGRRTLPLPGFVLEVIAPLVDGRSPDMPLLTSPRGRPWRATNFRRSFDRGIISAGIATQEGKDTVRVHDLRHSGVSLWLSEGVPLVTASRMAGHASVSITGDTYAHVLPDQLDEIAQTLDAAHEARAPMPVDLAARRSASLRRPTGGLSAATGTDDLRPRG
ncbi:Site-specific recombinase XerD [Austwickia chelonae]|uniref:Putative integrase n=1 Tax=Austwickia chelonae NBRC 105200 TaxID=1184607 RepID=K6VKD4_9MICO|nr:site-specific integrase [Austwickia chelonae]GAB77184.1 putative integrase [Austwickia chelonae NBRC 105200]SEW04670.1 Site-specific recombinase XerD [Austwickia chelonae]